MAYRKVDEASLTAVADAIREKSGTSEGLTFPEGFVNAVTGIQAGGGSGSGVATGYFIPETDLGSDCDITITHNLGEIPKLAIVYREHDKKMYNSTAKSGEVAFSYAVNKTYVGVGYHYSSNNATSNLTVSAICANEEINLESSVATTTTGSCIYSCTETTAKLYPICNANKKFIAGSKYRWILMTESACNALKY